MKIKSENARQVGELLQVLYEGCYAFTAVLDVATREHAEAQGSPIDYRKQRYVARKDGSAHTFAHDHYLRVAHEHPQVSAELKHAWFAGALLNAGNALKRFQYFDNAPPLEMIFHLRNGVAHGNKFEFDQRSAARLQRNPAHTRSSWSRGPGVFEIFESLRGQPIMFDYMADGDIIDVLSSARSHLTVLANQIDEGKKIRPSDDSV